MGMLLALYGKRTIIVQGNGRKPEKTLNVFQLVRQITMCLVFTYLCLSNVYKYKQY